MSIFRGKEGRPARKSYLSDMSALRVSWLDNLINLEKHKDILELCEAIKENLKQIQRLNPREPISIEQLELRYKHDTIEDYEKILRETKYMLTTFLTLKKGIRQRIATQYYSNKVLGTYDPYYAKAYNQTK